MQESIGHDFDPHSIESILSYAKKLKGITLREACGEDIQNHGYKGKGNFGQLLEKFYFGYDPNSKAEADFKDVGVELKSSPLKLLKNGDYRSKERLVLNIINYLEVHAEEFESSSFWKKNAHLLLVFYIYEKDKDILEYLIRLVDEWKYPDSDLLVIKKDWEIIRKKITDGKAHELSEGDTFYLGACTKGSTAAKSLRVQPFSEEKAKQRAFSLKQGYVNHIIANISKSEKGVFGKIIDLEKVEASSFSLEEIVESKFQPFYGLPASEIATRLNIKLNSKAKSYWASLTKAVLGIELNQKIEEFDKAEIVVKTVRLKENGLPAEDISFPNFKYVELIKTDWDNSDFKKILERKFFFVFYRIVNDDVILEKVTFWNIPYKDMLEAKKVWELTTELVRNGKIVKAIDEKGKRKTFFPKKSQNRVSHVRPHASNANDTYPLPIEEKFLKEMEYTKHCFWLNASYIRDAVYVSKGTS